MKKISTMLWCNVVMWYDLKGRVSFKIFPTETGPEHLSVTEAQEYVEQLVNAGISPKEIVMFLADRDSGSVRAFTPEVKDKE